MPVNAAYRVAVTGGLFSQLVVNTFGYQQMDGNTTGDSDMTQLGKAIDAVIVPNLYTVQGDLMIYAFAEIRRVAPAGGPIDGLDFTLTPGNGAIEEPPLPPSCAVVIRRKTSFLGRKYRGRIYIPGVAQTLTANGVVLAGAGGMNQMNALALILQGTIVSGDTGGPTWRPVLLARDASVTGGDNPGWRVNPVTLCQADNKLRSQRRREIGVGA